MKSFGNILLRLITVVLILFHFGNASAQINTEQVLNIGRNAMYFEDYVLSIQYFNQVISAKPYLAEPYFFRAVAKINLDDYKGAEQDATLAIERNPFITDAYQVRGVARQNMRNFQGAIEDYDAGLNILPEDKVFLLNKAVCAEELKQYDLADTTYKRLLQIDSRNERAYLGLAQLYLFQGDSVKAVELIDKSLSLTKNNPSAWAMRAMLQMRFRKDYSLALADIEEAIKLDPKFAGYFINRAYMKYNLDDYFGAKSDYDYALALDPLSIEGHFNRGLLLAEVGDNNKAIEDFSYVLHRNGDNFMALYNRAMLYTKTGQNRKALADIDAVLVKYPEFEAGYIARAEIKRKMGDRKGCENDYNKALAIFKSKKTHVSDFDPSVIEREKAIEKEQRLLAGEITETESEVITKFNDLLTVETDANIKPEYKNHTRGHVQNTNMEIDPAPIFTLTYYSHDNTLNGKTHYMREVADINDSHLLSHPMAIVAGETKLAESAIKEHFSSIEYYNGLLATSEPRSVDYLGRAMDYMLVKNVDLAIDDATRAIALSPKFTLAYFLRATARLTQWQMQKNKSLAETSSEDKNSEPLRGADDVMQLKEVISDFDQVIALSPKNVYAYFNKGNTFILMGNLTSAVACFSSAIELKPDLGEAYYNRGLTYMQLGNKELGIADLSKAGELGILPSYNVLKRMR